MKIVRDYLTSQELNYIVNAIIEKETALEREIVKVALVAQLICEDIGDFEDCNDIYDKVVADSQLNFSAIVNNYDIIDKLVEEETGVKRVLKDFVISINEKVTKSIENLDLNGAIKQLSDIANINEVKTNDNVKPITTNKKKG